ncbi:MAG: hypothetical protein IT441_00305 [Phycisphaeraceae bacterium]|nr:hypothetical protein [Phycisphaeraceae bacterium]
MTARNSMHAILPAAVMAALLYAGGPALAQENQKGIDTHTERVPVQEQPGQTTIGEPSPPPPATEAAEPSAMAQTQPAQTQPSEMNPSSEEILQRMLRRRQEIPVIEPNSQAPMDMPALGNLRPDPAVLGVAPGQDQPMLRREGEFVVSRRGRVFRTPDGFLQFRFEADSEQAPEPPVYLMPCQMLEHMEQLTDERKNDVVFVLSGQVFVYRGRNWLLPTMMRLDVDRGNLQK